MKETTQRRKLLLFCFIALLQQPHLCRGLASRKSKQRKQSGGEPSRGFGIVPPPLYVVDASPATAILLDFLEEEEVEGLDRLDVGSDDNGLRGVFAKEAIQQGEYICAIPFVSTILVDETFVETTKEDAYLQSASKIENAVHFLEISQKEQEKWHAYFDCLPSTRNNHFHATPDFWSREEIGELEVPLIVDDVLSRKAELEKLAQAGDWELNRLQVASWLVQSRAFTTLKKAIELDPDNAENITKEGLLQRTVMIPFLDFLNHASLGANTELQVVETKAYEESFYALTAICNIEKGTELRLQYGTGKETSMELFAKYGFLPQHNTQNDDAFLQTAAPVSWSTTLEDDKEKLKQILQDETKSADATIAIQKQILSFRIYTKELLQETESCKD